MHSIESIQDPVKSSIETFNRIRKQTRMNGEKKMKKQGRSLGPSESSKIKAKTSRIKKQPSVDANLEKPCVAQVFDSDILSRHIFRFVSFRDLVSCSMVNKKWHEKISEFIKNEKVCVILLKKSQDIVELVVSDAISRDPSTARLFQRGESNWLPNLRTLRIDSKAKDVPDNFIMQILSSTQNLKSIQGFIPPTYFANMSPEAMRLIRDLQIPADPSLVQVYSNFEGKSVRSVIMPHYWNWGDESLKHLVMTVKTLFEKIAPAVEELNVDESVLAMMMALNFPALKIVRLMRVRYCPDFNKETGGKLLRSIDFGKLFPSLEEIEVCVAEEHQYRPNTRFLKRRFQGPSHTFVCLSVMTLHLKSNGYHGWSVEEFNGVAQMFPNVKRFFGHHVAWEVETALWSTWAGLEYLEFTINNWFDVLPNEDHIFCGLSEKEVRQLFKKGIRFLKTYDNFQPRQPSILDLKNLKTMRVRIPHADGCRRPFGFKTDKVFLSKVTGELVFARTPKLTVEIMRKECGNFFSLASCNNSLKHLKPFVKFIDEEPTDEIEKEFSFQNYLPPKMNY